MSQAEQSKFFIESTSGHFEFTDEGLRELKPYFAKAGINIELIKTKAEYFEARRAVSHLFEGSLQKIASDGSSTLERRALMAAVGDSEQEFEELLNKVKKKQQLNLKVV